MKVSEEVVKWLRENAYAVKGDEFYFLPDFPPEQTPDYLHIPIRPKKWREIAPTTSKERL